MTPIHRLNVAALLAVLLTGCGHTAVTGTLAAKAKLRPVPTAMVAGQERAFGFDYERFQQDQAPAQRPNRTEGTVFLPAQVDNRKWCSRVVDQGKLSACTAFALGRGMREYMQNKNGEHATALSAMWLYYREREHMGEDYIGRDVGSTVTDGAWVLLQKGCATENSWPYAAPRFAIEPSQLADATAGQWRVHLPGPVYGLDGVKAAVAEGQAVAFGFKAYESIRSIGPTGVMPMPKAGERLLGGHAVLAVGYDDESQLVTCRNSWGAGWGDQGYFYMPYEFLKNSSNTMDFWSAKI